MVLTGVTPAPDKKKLYEALKWWTTPESERGEIPENNPYIARYHDGFAVDNELICCDMMALLRQDINEINIYRGRRAYALTQDLMHDYRSGIVNNGDEVWFRGEVVEILGMFHRDEDEKMYLGILLVESGVKALVDVHG